MTDPTHSRRLFLRQAGGLAALAMPALHAHGAANRAGPALAASERISTDALEIAYFATGPEDGRPVVLVHDFGYGIDSFARTAPLLAAAGLRVLAPQMRGHGATRFLDAAAPRTGQQAALGKDLIDFIDALHIPEAVFAGFGWGAHAAWAASQVRPTRCVGLVLAGAGRIDEAGPQERYLYLSGTGRRALAAQRHALARAAWRRLSPQARFDAALFGQVGPSLDNPDYVAVLAHAWLTRHAPAHPDAAAVPRYAALEKKFTQPPGTLTAAITLAGGASGAPPAARIVFGGLHSHRVVPGAGHDLPHEAPHAFADAALELVRNGKWRT